MTGIYVLVGLIVKITITGFLTFVILQALKSVKRRALREEIANVEAKMAAYRINLKNRVKRKAKRFRGTYPVNILKDSPFDNALNQLTSITFENNSEFQVYMDLCKRINALIEVAKIDKHSDTAKAKLAETEKCDFMCTDFKNEINIVRLINDMVSVSKTLTKQVERFNSLNGRVKRSVPATITFDSLMELQQVFKIKEIQDGLSDKPQTTEAKLAA